jgi:hypothetical protein
MRISTRRIDLLSKHPSKQNADPVIGGTGTPPIGAAGGPPFLATVPRLVSRIIEDRRSPESARRLSFTEIVAQLKAQRFEIMAGVDSDEV